MVLNLSKPQQYWSDLVNMQAGLLYWFCILHKDRVSLACVNILKIDLSAVAHHCWKMSYYDLISKFQVGLKSLLCQWLSEPEFYADLVCKLKKIVGSNNFSAQFIKIISTYKKIGYNINVLQQTACLVVNPITVGNFAFLFNCTPVGRTSDSLMVRT